MRFCTPSESNGIELAVSDELIVMTWLKQAAVDLAAVRTRIDL
jgi:hypothetical protein